MRTTKAIKACAEWLSYCLSIGWSKDDLNDLEALWWQYHDDYGKLRRGKCAWVAINRRVAKREPELFR